MHVGVWAISWLQFAHNATSALPKPETSCKWSMRACPQSTFTKIGAYPFRRRGIFQMPLSFIRCSLLSSDPLFGFLRAAPFHILLHPSTIDALGSSLLLCLERGLSKPSLAKHKRNLTRSSAIVEKNVTALPFSFATLRRVASVPSRQSTWLSFSTPKVTNLVIHPFQGLG